MEKELPGRINLLKTKNNRKGLPMKPEEKTKDRKELRLKIRPMDFAVLAAVVLFAVLLEVGIIRSRGEVVRPEAQIYQDSVLIETLPLNEDAVFTVKGTYTNVVTVRDGKVFVSESDCPGKDCVHSGKISSSGAAIVCLPNRVEIRIAGGYEGTDDIDGVVR